MKRKFLTQSLCNRPFYRSLSVSSHDRVPFERNPIKVLTDNILSGLNQLPEHYMYGRVAAIQGMMGEVGGFERELTIGSRCKLNARGGPPVTCEVVGFREGRALLMPFSGLEGLGEVVVGAESETLDLCVELGKT